VRNRVVIPSLIVLLWGFLQGPFDHIHGEELEHAATTAPVHFHMHEARADFGACIGSHTADDDDIDVPWNAALAAPLVLHPETDLGEGISFPAPCFTSVAVSVARHRGHDPPDFSPKIPRAPPA
jgi:hypothetical protein